MPRYLCHCIDQLAKAVYDKNKRIDLVHDSEIICKKKHHGDQWYLLIPGSKKNNLILPVSM
jgi:hypothetical protein